MGILNTTRALYNENRYDEDGNDTGRGKRSAIGSLGEAVSRHFQSAISPINTIGRIFGHGSMIHTFARRRMGDAKYSGGFKNPKASVAPTSGGSSKRPAGKSQSSQSRGTIPVDVDNTDIREPLERIDTNTSETNKLLYKMVEIGEKDQFKADIKDSFDEENDKQRLRLFSRIGDMIAKLGIKSSGNNSSANKSGGMWDVFKGMAMERFVEKYVLPALIGAAGAAFGAGAAVWGSITAGFAAALASPAVLASIAILGAAMASYFAGKAIAQFIAPDTPEKKAGRERYRRNVAGAAPINGRQITGGVEGSTWAAPRAERERNAIALRKVNMERVKRGMKPLTVMPASIPKNTYNEIGEDTGIRNAPTIGKFTVGGAGMGMVSGGADETVVPPEAARLLNAIAGSESSEGGGYNMIVGSGKYGAPATLSDMSDHPRIKGVGLTHAGGEWLNVNDPRAKTSSSAAGRYQFTATTWDALHRKHPNLPKDFSPASQDMAAWQLAQDEYSRISGRNLQVDLADPSRHAQVEKTLSGTWSSLRGGLEPNSKTGGFLSRLNQGNTTTPAGSAPIAMTATQAPTIPKLNVPAATVAAVASKGQATAEIQNSSLAAQIPQSSGTSGGDTVIDNSTTFGIPPQSGESIDDIVTKVLTAMGVMSST